MIIVSQRYSYLGCGPRVTCKVCGLKAKDVLGLISFLREQRSCKVALILNDETLEGKDREDFESHLEKVVDVSLRFEPTPTQVASIGAPGTGDDERYAADRCAALGIANIRVVKRVVKLVETVKPTLADADPEVLRAAIASLALFCWCRDEPDEAPSLDYIAAKTQDPFGFAVLEAKTDEGSEDNVARWNSKLNAYGYMWSDDLDLALIDGVRKGFFDRGRLREEARRLSEKLGHNRAQGSFEDAWRRFHDSFDTNQDEVLDGIRDAFLKNMQYLSPTNLSGTVSMFKRLGRSIEAEEMIARYIDARKSEPRLFDLDDDAFGRHVEDPDVRTAFNAVTAARPEATDFIELLAGAKEDWSSERIEALAGAPFGDYVAAFKHHRGEKVRRLVANALQFSNVGNATPAMRGVTEKAKEALRAIAKESPINALRVANLGIGEKSLGREFPDPEELQTDKARA